MFFPEVSATQRYQTLLLYLLGYIPTYLSSYMLNFFVHAYLSLKILPVTAHLYRIELFLEEVFYFSEFAVGKH